MGCANYHARIRFTDGSSTRLVRIPRTFGGLIPQSLIDYPVSSEYATLKFLETTKVPSPRAFSYGIQGSKENRIGVSYLVMEEFPGQLWNGQGRQGRKSANMEDRAKVWEDLADILIELKRHPFPKACSLQIQDTDSKIVPSVIASDRFLVLDLSGPYETALDYYSGFVEQNMELISDGQLFPDFPVNAYFVFLFMKESIPNLLEKTSPQPKREFYLKHIDDKGDHLMVDDDLNITGVIDWQMALTVPANEAFGPSLVIADMNRIYGGISCLTTDDLTLAQCLREKGAQELAETMSADERLRRFFFALDCDLPWDETLQLVRGIWAAFGVENAQDMDWQEWKRSSLEKYKGDTRLQVIIRQYGLGDTIS